MAAPFRGGNMNSRSQQMPSPSRPRNWESASPQIQNRNFNASLNGNRFETPSLRFQEQIVQSNPDVGNIASSFRPQTDRVFNNAIRMMPPPAVPDVLKWQVPPPVVPPSVGLDVLKRQTGDIYGGMSNNQQTAMQIENGPAQLNQNFPPRMPPPDFVQQSVLVNQDRTVNANPDLAKLNKDSQVPCLGQIVQNCDTNKDIQNMPKQDDIATAQEDINWLDQWLPRVKNRCTVSQTRCSLNLSEVQMKTRQMLVLIAKLQKQRQILETLRDEDRSIWDQKLFEIEKTKAELGQVKDYLNSEETMSELKKKTVHRKKKRERLKRHRKEEYERQCEELERREQLHNEIDRNMEKVRLKEKAAKQEKDLQKEVDQIMGQVKKKMTENTRAMQLLQGLQKLRQMRRDRQERQGVHSSSLASVKVFDVKTEELKRVLEKQEQIYKTEESALKVILETEQEETREKEREKERLKEIERQIKEEKKIDRAFFGSYKEPRPDDPLFPFKQYYDAANQSFDAFLNIRHEWDKYLVREGTPGGSRIPDQWVLPPEPSSDIWASALQHR